MESADQLITDNLDIWSSVIQTKSAAGRGKSKKLELYGIKKLRELILEMALRGLLVPQDPNDEPASELLKKIAAEKAKLIKEGKVKQKKLQPISDEEKLFDLPEGWLWERFGYLSEHNAGKTLDRSRNKGELRDYITTSNLYWGEFKLTDVKQMPIQDSDLEKCLATKNDLLICEGGEAGRAAVWQEDYNICIQNHIHRARFWKGISPFFAYRLLEKISYTEEIDNYRKGVGISNMSGKALSSIPFPLPPIAEQNRIVAKVDELMALCDQLEQQTESSISAHQTLVQTLLGTLTNASEREGFNQAWARISEHFDTLFTTEWSIDQLKQTILQLAVMGKLVPQNPNDEPASELLKKITAEKERLIKEGKIKKQKVLPSIEKGEKPFELPVGWEWGRLGNITNYGLSDKMQPEDLNDDLWVLELEDVEKTTSKLLQKIRYSDRKFKSSKNCFKKNDVVYGKLRPYLDKVIVADEDGVCTTEMIPVRSYSSVTPHYLRLVMKSPYFIRYANDSTHGMNLPRMGTDKARIALFPIAPEKEQHRIVAKVDELIALCDTLQMHIISAQNTQLQLADAMVEKAIT